MYRRRALSRLDAPEQLDEAIRLATVPGWLITVALVLAVGGTAVWAAVATVPRTVDARGVITHSAGVSSLDAVVGGLVTQVWAGVDQRIYKGRPLYSLAGTSGAVQVVTAPWDAYVTSWLAREGQLLQPGMTVAELVRLDTPGDRLQARVYLRSSYAPMVTAGVPVELEADAAPAAVFGTLHGTVVSVGQFPESEDSLRAYLGDSADVHGLLAGGNVVAVTVALELDPGSASGLRWSKAGPPFGLSSQSEVTAQFTVAEEHPVNWLVRR
jgi:multidrug resistance efflux pump